MPSLEVDLYGTRVGRLVGASWRDFDFVADEAGWQRFGVGSTVLSESVPLVPRPPRGKAGRRRNFFDELLPEGSARQRLADRAGVAPFDTLGLLAAYGRDAAGAVTIWDAEAVGGSEPPRARPLTNTQVGDLLRDVAEFPLGNAPRLGKASLAGVQDKVLLARVDGGWAQCLHGYPSTHILKPESRPYTDMVFNEEYVARIGRAMGLVPYATEIEAFDGTDALVIERYDRDPSMDGGRLHQEDFNQVLGAAGVEKYQEHGGKVSLARVASVVASTQGSPGLQQLLALVTLSVAVGNLDLHAKNIALLHPPTGPALVAPAYDVVPLAHYPGVDGRMAMAVNDVYEFERIAGDDVVAEAERWGMKASAAVDVMRSVRDVIIDVASAEEPHARATPELAGTIAARAQRLRLINA